MNPSFDLDQDHVELRSWLHEFAADVIRPAASEWDEKEEFPWPVVEEAAKVGIYSLDFWTKGDKVVSYPLVVHDTPQ